MCGIAGILSKYGQSAPAGSIKLMTDAMRHRGPDGEGFYSDDGIQLGHRRLSIIDLDHGQQPMTNEDKRLQLVFNGEIYNYRELMTELRDLGHAIQTNCDSEVILHAYEEWGDQCVHRFNGMWAFAIWDIEKKELFLSRDRFGIKPLYYQQSDEQLLFASEIKAILAGGVCAEADLQSIAMYLSDGYLNYGQRTLFNGISQLQPGHNLYYREQSVKVQEYWPTEEYKNSCASVAHIEPAEFRSLLSDAVSLRLRSDVPVGSALSGGLDSSSIVTLANELTRATESAFSYNTYTASFPGFAKDETEFVKLLSKENDCVTAWVRMDGDELRSDLATMTASQEVPIPAGSLYAQWRVMKRAHEDGIKVLLDGQGGDEVLAGYPLFFPAAAADYAFALNFGQAIGTLDAMSRYHQFSRIEALKYFVFSLCPAAIQGRLRAMLKKQELPLHDRLKARSAAKSFESHPKLSRRLTKQQWMLLRYWQLPDLLHFEDRNSMAFSIETRLPFLDYRIVEMGMRLATELKIKGRRGKWILREAMKTSLPAAILDRYDKIGFAAPDDEWLKGNLGDFLRELVMSDSFRNRDWVDPRYLEELSADLQELSPKLLWRMAGLELWARTFLDGN